MNQATKERTWEKPAALQNCTTPRHVVSPAALGETKEAIYQEIKGNSPMAKLLSTLLLTKKLASKCRCDEGVPEPEYEGVSLDSSIVETSSYFKKNS